MPAAALGKCFDTAAEAAAYMCGTAFPKHHTEVILTSGGNSGAGTIQYTHTCVGSTATTLSLQRSQSTVAGVAGYTHSVGFPSCDPATWPGQYEPWNLSASDGALISAAVIGCWLLAWAWRGIRATLKDHDNE
jgi:hypothetical protein